MKKKRTQSLLQGAHVLLRKADTQGQSYPIGVRPQQKLAGGSVRPWVRGFHRSFWNGGHLEMGLRNGMREDNSQAKATTNASKRENEELRMGNNSDMAGL